jgi:hypothetical protein
MNRPNRKLVLREKTGRTAARFHVGRKLDPNVRLSDWPGLTEEERQAHRTREAIMTRRTGKY